MFKVGLSSCGKILDERLFAEYAHSGIDAIEISPSWFEYKDLDYQMLYRWSRQYDIQLWSYHLPFPTTNLCSSDQGIRLCSVEYLCELIKQAGNICVEKFVVHAGLEPVSLEPDKRAEAIKCSKDSLDALANHAEKYNAVVCVEDLPRSCLGNCSEEILDLISVNDKLRICLDTNHLLKEENSDFISMVGSKIVTTHISDYDYVDERHWLPGEGKICWQSLLNNLKDIHYQGVWMYEIGFRCPETRIRSRDLKCSDFVRNAKELFNNQEITIVR